MKTCIEKLDAMLIDAKKAVSKIEADSKEEMASAKTRVADEKSKASSVTGTVIK